MNRFMENCGNGKAGRIRRWSELGMAAILALQIGLLLHTCGYTFFTADDYWHAVEAGGAMESAGAVWKAAFAFMQARYAGWQGTYLTMFLQIALCPLNYAGVNAYAALHVLLIVVCLGFFLALYLFVRELAKWTGFSSERGIAGVYVLAVTCLLNLRSYAEDFFWFSGAVSYTIPLMLALTGAALLVRSLRLQQGGCRLRLAGAAVFMLLACGGSLQIAVPVCYGMLVLGVYLFVHLFGRKKCVRKRTGRRGNGAFWYLLPIAAALIGTAINGLAPGNYVRHDVTAEKSGMLKTLYHAAGNTLFQLFDETGRVMDTSALCFMLVLAVLAGVLLAPKTAWGGQWRKA